MDNEIKRLKEEIYHLQEECNKEVDNAYKFNSGQIYNLNMEINRIRKEVSRSDNLLAQHNLSEEDVNNIKRNINNLLIKREKILSERNSLSIRRDIHVENIKREYYSKIYILENAIYNLESAEAEKKKKAEAEEKAAKKKKASDSIKNGFIKKAMAEKLFIPEKKPSRINIGYISYGEKIRNAYLCILKDYDYRRIKYCNKRDVHGVYTMNAVINNLNKVWEEGDFQKYVDFSKAVVKGGQPVQCFRNVPNWVDEVVDDELNKWFSWYFDSNYIFRKIKHKKVGKSYADMVSSYNPAITGVCGDYGKCFDIDPYGKDAESACYEKMIEDAITSFGSIGCQKI